MENIPSTDAISAAVIFLEKKRITELQKKRKDCKPPVMFVFFFYLEGGRKTGDIKYHILYMIHKNIQVWITHNSCSILAVNCVVILRDQVPNRDVLVQ